VTWRRLGKLGAGVLLGLCCFFVGDAASWAAEGDPDPMPSPYGVAQVWRCVDVSPDPYVTPTPAPDPPEPSPTSTATRCYVTSWATPAPIPTVTATATETVTPTASPSPTSTGPVEVSVTDSQYGPFLLGLGVVVLLGSASFIAWQSAPPTFGIKR